MANKPLDRKALVDEYWKMKEFNPRLSIREFSNIKNLKYYTFRDWFRDWRYNSKWSSTYDERRSNNSSAE